MRKWKMKKDPETGIPLIASDADRPHLRLPPPDSEIWPEFCRGELWDWETASFCVNRCQLCAYSCPPTPERRRWDKFTGEMSYLLCVNRPDSPGQLHEVPPTGWCRNFQPKRWLPERARKARPEAAVGEADNTIRRIPLGHNRFAIVDVADFAEVNKHKWCASNKRGSIYAMRRNKEGRTVYMHREITQAPKGAVVDHIDHNTINNRRGNLRVCTLEQNYANMGPHGGSSGFVGVYPRGQGYEAGITWHGEHFYLGHYDNPVEAAQARDRKAYELHGPYAYLNFPDDFRGRGGEPRKTTKGVKRGGKGVKVRRSGDVADPGPS